MEEKQLKFVRLRHFPEDLIDIMIKQRRIFIPPHNIDKHKKIILEALNIK